MEIQKYQAVIADSDTVVVGYISEVRQYLGDGSYSNGTDYLITVTEKSMPNGNYGTFKIEPESIEPFNDISRCKHENTEPLDRYGNKKCFVCGKFISHLDS